MTGKNWKLTMATLLLWVATPAMGHEGHDAPGALPAPPHGGKVAEAAHTAKHEGGAEERELFAEAKLQGSLLKLYALGLEAENTKVWKALAPSASLTVTEAKIEMPRSKKAVPVTFKAVTDGWEAEVGTLKERRVILHATFLDGKEKKLTKVQLEK